MKKRSNSNIKKYENTFVVFLLSKIIRFLKHTPLFPYSLYESKFDQANNLLLKSICGRVLEVGAGDGLRKQFLLKTYPNITSYISTDYSSWNSYFKELGKKIIKDPVIGVIHNITSNRTIDKYCDATDLPFPSHSFDYHISFEVLEHIANPTAFFHEAARVVKKGGFIYLTTPFLFRIHGGEPNHRMDYCRYLNGYYYQIAKENKLKVIALYSNTGIGTTVSVLLTQWFMVRTYESHILLKMFFVFILLLLTPVFNVVGYIIDLKPDTRFATKYHVLFKKI